MLGFLPRLQPGPQARFWGMRLINLWAVPFAMHGCDYVVWSPSLSGATSFLA
jgi:hypothetical protein